jgi:hypothetical protein
LNVRRVDAEGGDGGADEYDSAAVESSSIAPMVRDLAVDELPEPRVRCATTGACPEWEDDAREDWCCCS